jgi:glycosyltransferase involved in cell wall biosynthesis
MAVGTPVVTTPQVAAALAARDGEHLLLGDSTEELAARAAAILIDPARSAALAGAAHALVRQRYTWDASAAAVEAAWGEARARAASCPDGAAR